MPDAFPAVIKEKGGRAWRELHDGKLIETGTRKRDEEAGGREY
jgi:hypothetical protein